MDHAYLGTFLLEVVSFCLMYYAEVVTFRLRKVGIMEYLTDSRITKHGARLAPIIRWLQRITRVMNLYAIGIADNLYWQVHTVQAVDYELTIAFILSYIIIGNSNFVCSPSYLFGGKVKQKSKNIQIIVYIFLFIYLIFRYFLYLCRII